MTALDNKTDEISAIAAYEKRIAQLEDKLAAANDKSLAKSEQIAAISHDVRTAIGGVISTSELLMDTELDDVQAKYSGTVLESARSLMKILNQILDISKLEAGKLELETENFEPAAIVHSAVEAMKARADEKGLGIETAISLQLPDLLQGDAGRIRQALTNLADNAIKFTSEGKVTICLDCEEQDGGYVLQFIVADTGIGLDHSEQAQLFRQFEQADASISRKFGGTGLGLSLVRKLARAMGGEASCESVKGEGSTFSFTVFCETAKAGREQPKLALTEEPVQNFKPAHILVVEDNHINQMLITTYLEKFGHTFEAVSSGVEALEALKGGGYDLVLMDIHMPEMDGIETTKHIRALDGDTANIPIIAITANAMKGDRERYLAAGMDEYVSKPVNVPDLYAKIAGCV